MVITQHSQKLKLMSEVFMSVNAVGYTIHMQTVTETPLAHKYCSARTTPAIVDDSALHHSSIEEPFAR